MSAIENSSLSGCPRPLRQSSNDLGSLGFSRRSVCTPREYLQAAVWDAPHFIPVIPILEKYGDRILAATRYVFIKLRANQVPDFKWNWAGKKLDKQEAELASALAWRAIEASLESTSLTLHQKNPTELEAFCLLNSINYKEHWLPIFEFVPPSSDEDAPPLEKPGLLSLLDPQKNYGNILARTDRFSSKVRPTS